MSQSSDRLANQASETVRPKRVQSLDGLRALAILFIVIGHGIGTIAFHEQVPDLVWSILGNAEIGVSIFFVISGFFITKSLIQEIELKNSINFLDFYRRRFAKLLPPYYVYLIVILLFGTFHLIDLPLSAWFSAFFLFINYSPLPGSWWVGHSWFLCIMVLFYILWPISFSYLGRKRATWLAGISIVAIPLIRVITYFLLPGLRERIPVMFHTRVDILMFGSLLALLYDHPKFVSFCQQAFRYGFHVFAAIFLLAVSPFLSAKFQGAYLLPIGYSLNGFLTTMSIFWLMGHPHSMVAKILNFKVFVHIGAISYSVYLWQQLFMTRQNTSFTGLFPWNLLCTLAIAELSYQLIERSTFKMRSKPTSNLGK
ncbi:hypothetical protein TUMEXPCC7403_18265 [Tumidithrix helvetica PCC 7403]|uniref:acyltransferase family protein n=1 Tax=Tumidithrix helvetica TaxID=3457545 RepID=UPI003CAFA226